MDLKSVKQLVKEQVSIKPKFASSFVKKAISVTISIWLLDSTFFVLFFFFVFSVSSQNVLSGKIVCQHSIRFGKLCAVCGTELEE